MTFCHGIPAPFRVGLLRSILATHGYNAGTCHTIKVLYTERDVYNTTVGNKT